MVQTVVKAWVHIDFDSLWACLRARLNVVRRGEGRFTHNEEMSCLVEDLRHLILSALWGSLRWRENSYVSNNDICSCKRNAKWMPSAIIVDSMESRKGFLDAGFISMCIILKVKASLWKSLTSFLCQFTPTLQYFLQFHDPQHYPHSYESLSVPCRMRKILEMTGSRTIMPWQRRPCCHLESHWPILTRAWASVEWRWPDCMLARVVLRSYAWYEPCRYSYASHLWAGHKPHWDARWQAKP